MQGQERTENLRGSCVMANVESMRKFLEEHPDLLAQWNTVRESLAAKRAIMEFLESMQRMSEEYVDAGLEFPADELLDEEVIAENSEKVVLQHFQLFVVRALVEDMSTDVKTKLAEVITEDNFVTCLADSKQHLLDDLQEVLLSEKMKNMMMASISNFPMFPMGDGVMHAAGVMLGGLDGSCPASDGVEEMLAALFGGGLMGYGGHDYGRGERRVIQFHGGADSDEFDDEE